MAPEVFGGYRKYLAELGLHFDTLSSSALQSGAILTGERFMGRMFGVNFMTSNRYSVPSGQGDWKMHAFTTSCFTFAMKPPYVQILEPGVLQSGPHWRLIQINRWAIQEINPAHIGSLSVDINCGNRVRYQPITCLLYTSPSPRDS